MLVEDGGDISFGHALVPDAVWVDDHGGSQLAGTQAVRGSHDDLAEQIALHHPEVELVEDAHGAFLSAGTLGMAGGTGIFAHEDVVLGLRHDEAPLRGSFLASWPLVLPPVNEIGRASCRERV